jgi:hypothetical protein|tara:strand:- start:301 stop:411 length:111 start_codon:yes stop_codon:yes gene_type:complete
MVYKYISSDEITGIETILNVNSYQKRGKLARDIPEF